MRSLAPEVFLFGCLSEGLRKFQIRAGVVGRNGPRLDQGVCCAGYQGM
jgi:hypothetical protein